MTQATSVIFRIGPVRITRFIRRFVWKKATTKGNLEKPQKFNKFSKLSTKSCMSRAMDNLKESFTIMKAITRTTILKMMILYVTLYLSSKGPFTRAIFVAIFF